MARPSDWIHLDEASHLMDLAEEAGLNDPNLLDHIHHLVQHGLKRLIERDQEFPTFRPHGRVGMIGDE